MRRKGRAERAEGSWLEPIVCAAFDSPQFAPSVLRAAEVIGSEPSAATHATRAAQSGASRHDIEYTQPQDAA